MILEHLFNFYTKLYNTTAGRNAYQGITFPPRKCKTCLKNIFALKKKRFMKKNINLLHFIQELVARSLS